MGDVDCYVFVLKPLVEEEEEEEEDKVLVVEEETPVKKKKKKDKKKHIKEEPVSEEEPCTSTAVPVCLLSGLVLTAGQGRVSPFKSTLIRSDQAFLKMFVLVEKLNLFTYCVYIM